MQFRHLGRSGLKISEISFGNWLTHGAQIDEEAARACVHAALDSGITTFDTADVYADGAAESVLGRALEGQRRESLEILTKVYWSTGPGGPNDSGLSRKHIRESIEASLRRLRTDYVDVYQAHRYDHETPLDETIQAFGEVVRSGKALYIGVSEWTAEQLISGTALARDLGVPLISNQPEYSMLWRVIEADVIPASEKNGLCQIVFSPIAQGILTGKYQPGKEAPQGSRATDSNGSSFVRRLLGKEHLLSRIQQLRPIAEEAGLTMPQLAVAWVLQNPNVASAIIGASRPEQVSENVKASGITLDSGVLKRIDDVLGDGIVRDPSFTANRSPQIRD